LPTIEHSISIDAPRPELFALSQDYALRSRWDPFVREMKFLGGAAAPDVGVCVWVRAKNGLTMTVRFVTMTPPELVAMTMVEGPRIFRQFAGTWRFQAQGELRTRVTFRYHFAITPRVLGAVLNPVITRILGRDIRARLEGMKNAAEATDVLQCLQRDHSHAPSR
jgi:ribosome-associated toxin RatA of RatAB toxin-antitoxin module